MRYSQPLGHTKRSVDTPDDCSLDGHLFLRYLKTLLRIFILVSLILLPVLLPVNYMSGRGVHQTDGLDQLSWTNVAAGKIQVYWIHCILSIMVIVWVWRVIWFEMRSLVQYRHRRLMVQAQRKDASAILVTDIPSDLHDKQQLSEIYGLNLGRVRNVWIQRDFKRLGELIHQRDDLALSLERAETELICRTSTATHRQDQEERPQCRLPLWGLAWMPKLGRQVDAIDHNRKALQRANEDLEKFRQCDTKGDGGCAIILFEDAKAAHLASQVVYHPEAHSMQGSYIDPLATKFVWKNIALLLETTVHSQGLGMPTLYLALWHLYRAYHLHWSLVTAQLSRAIIGSSSLDFGHSIMATVCVTRCPTHYSCHTCLHGASYRS